jgi:3-oxoacyl-[acyl-carrier-protein] synthase II
MAERRVVITGIGMVSPVGNSRDETWKALLDGKSGGGPITSFDPSQFACQIAAEVKNLNTEPTISKKEVNRIDRFTVFGLVAASEAWADAELEGHSYDPTRMGVIFGVGIGGLLTMEENYREFSEGGPRKISPFLIPAMISNLAPGHVAIKYNLQGINFTITSACTSGTHAIGESYRMIKNGLQDVVVTGGTEAAITYLGVGGFSRMKALTCRNDDPTKASRPFDRDRDGFLIGEGAGVLVLEEMEAAKKRDAKIYAEIIGYGASCDAFHITGQPEGGRGAQVCMQNALNDAKIEAKSVGYINAHGTSTPVNDPSETAAIKAVFGNHAKEGLMVSSTKSMTGHLLGAAGAVEGAVIALTLTTGKVAPTINLDNPDEGCDLDYVPKVSREASVEIAMSNSFGFGGTNASVIMKRV